MASDVTVPQRTMETKQIEINLWLEKNAGKGSTRYAGPNNVRHWLNGDNWLNYELDDVTVFVFKDAQLAVEFALRFS